MHTEDTHVSLSMCPLVAVVDENDDANWREAFDPKTNRPYYYNKKTKVTTWEVRVHATCYVALKPFG